MPFESAYPTALVDEQYDDDEEEDFCRLNSLGPIAWGGRS